MLKGNRGENFSSRRVARVLCLLGVLALAPADAFAQAAQPPARGATPPAAGHDQHAGGHDHAGGHEHHAAPSGPRRGVETASPEALIKLNRVGLSPPDEEVLDQDGRRVRFHADLLKGKVAVVSFVYTSCVYTCAAQGKYLANLQAALGERLGREVFFVVVSTDPETDTPARLKRWGETFGAKAGWTFVTGGKTPLENVRGRFPGVRSGRDVHDSIIFIGNDARGLWVRADAIRPTEEILALLDAVAAPPPAEQP